MACLHGSAGIAATAEVVKPPVAEVRNVPSTLHGTVVSDPYRWTEETQSPQSQA